MLIDDTDKQIKAFELHGGIVWTFPQPWNERHSEQEGKVDLLIKTLESLV